MMKAVVSLFSIGKSKQEIEPTPDSKDTNNSCDNQNATSAIAIIVDDPPPMPKETLEAKLSLVGQIHSIIPNQFDKPPSSNAHKEPYSPIDRMMVRHLIPRNNSSTTRSRPADNHNGASEIPKTNEQQYLNLVPKTKLVSEAERARLAAEAADAAAKAKQEEELAERARREGELAAAEAERARLETEERARLAEAERARLAETEAKQEEEARAAEEAEAQAQAQDTTLVDSIFKQDALKKYFFSIFIPPEDDNKEKSIASTHSPAPTITPVQETELKETLEKCAGAYISGDTDLPPSDPSTPQSSSTKTTSTTSPKLKEKALPPVYFGVGIKTELAEDGDKKFLKITEIFSNSNLHKEKRGNVDYTNQFITHLNCKLEDDTVAKEYSITAIFNKFKGDLNQKEKFDEKIDQIFRDISQTSINFKISASKSQTDPAGKPAETAEVNINKIIFEKTQDGAYKQKTTTPSTTTATIDAKNAAAGPVGKAV